MSHRNPGTRAFRQPLRLAAFGALLVCTASCRTIDNRIGLPPILEYDRSTRELFVRPLFSVGPDEVRVVWPIFRHRTNEKGTSMWLLPLVWYSARPQEGGIDRDLYILPCIAWGDDPVMGSHFAFFPIGGSIKSFLGRDEFSFWLFPVYARMREKDSRSHHVLWPLINWIDAPHNGGGRVLPFWGHYWTDSAEGKPKDRRSYLCWPFFSWHRNGLDTSNPSSGWAFFPFYAHSASEHVATTHIMWPLYAHIDDRARGYKVWGCSLVPIRFGFGPDDYQVDLWPFYGTWMQKDRSRQFALWPFQRYESQDTPQSKARRFWIVPFWWDTDVEWPQLETSLSRRKLWPLFSYEEKGDVMHWETLSLLPWYDDVTETFWGRLIQLARYSRRGSARGFELLWGLFSWENGPEAAAWRIAGGLFAREREGEAVTYRIFFIPFGG